MSADHASHRVVVIGLDMGDARLIEEWARNGRLPNLAALMDVGTWCQLETTAGILHTSTWPTFATGNNPGKHGVYYPYQPTPGHQEAQLIASDQYGCPTFWQRADRQGVNSVVFDVPETFPEQGFGGSAVYEWGNWAWYGDQKTQPESLLEDLRKEFGRYPLGMEAKRLGLKFPNQKQMRERLLKSVAHKRQVFQWLLDNADWQLGVMVFGETHPAGHYLWPRGVLESESSDAAVFDDIRSVYEAIDREIGSLRKSLAEDVSLLVVSGDGVTTNHCGWHLMPEVLERLGYSSPPQADLEQDAPKRRRLSLGAIKNMLPKKARRFIADSLPWWLRDKIGAHMQAEQIDWSTSKAFALPTDLEGCVRINLKGREPHGIVEPGAEYEELCAKIVDDLAQLKNPATGKSAVRSVWQLRKEFVGDSLDHLPDITVTWDNSAPISALESDRIGQVAGESPDPRTGTHSVRGFCLAAGPAFATGGREHAKLTDVAATVLDLLNVDTDDMDGAPIPVSR